MFDNCIYNNKKNTQAVSASVQHLKNDSICI